MKIHEYQGKEILRNFGVPVPRGIPAFTVQEAVEAAQKLGGPVWVVKAQIHAGGRGKGGGVKVAKTIDDVKARASEILGMQLKSPTRPALRARRSAACTSKTAPTSRTSCTSRWSPTAPRRRWP